MEVSDNDVTAIRDVILRQFASMTWAKSASPDLQTFKDDFLANAALYPSSRPLSGQSIEEFGQRMSHLARTSLRSFHERVLGAKMHVFGNVPVAVVACENTENDSDVNRNVEMMLLVKDSGRWKIAAQAWDRETTNRQIPADFLSHV